MKQRGYIVISHQGDVMWYDIDEWPAAKDYAIRMVGTVYTCRLVGDYS